LRKRVNEKNRRRVISYGEENNGWKAKKLSRDGKRKVMGNTWGGYSVSMRRGNLALPDK